MIDRNFSKMNLERFESQTSFGLDISEWEPERLVRAIVGTAAEASATANELHLCRHRVGLINRGGNESELTESLIGELGDMAGYIDLVLQRLGVDPGEAIRKRFNQVSRRDGVPFELSEEPGKDDHIWLNLKMRWSKALGYETPQPTAHLERLTRKLRAEQAVGRAAK